MGATLDAGGLRGSLVRLAPVRRGRLRPPAGEGALSLLLHALAVALMLLAFQRHRLNDHAGPASVAVVFEGGPRASTPQTQESRRSSPTTAPDERAIEQTPPGATPSPPPAPSHAAAAPAAPSAPAAAPAMAPVPPVTTGASALSLPPPALVTRPVPRTNAARRPPAAAASPFSALSAPMNLSLAGRPPPPSSEGHLKRGITLSMAPTDQNRNVMTRYAEARHKLGEDWWSAFSAFVEAHKYYPMAAALNGEDGQSVLHLWVQRDGTVRSVQVELSSGSPRLDMAWISEFRGAKVPAFPPGTTEDEIDFSASMTYILERQ